MAGRLSLDDMVWRREPVGPDLDYDEIAALLDEVVRFRLLLSGYGRDFALLVEPTEPRRTMWAESLGGARQRWEDAIHRRFYFRGKPDEVVKLDHEAPTDGFSMWPKRKRRQQEIARLWARSLAIDFDTWAEHVEHVAMKPIASLHDDLWSIYGSLAGSLLVLSDATSGTGLQRAEAEMINIIHVWSEVGGVKSDVDLADELVAVIFSATAAQSLSLDFLWNWGAGRLRADVPGLLSMAREAQA